MEYLLPVPATLVSNSKPSRQDVAFFYTDPTLGCLHLLGFSSGLHTKIRPSMPAIIHLPS